MKKKKKKKDKDKEIFGLMRLLDDIELLTKYCEDDKAYRRAVRNVLHVRKEEVDDVTVSELYRRYTEVNRE